MNFAQHSHPTQSSDSFADLCQILSSRSISPRAAQALSDPKRTAAILALSEEEGISATLYEAIAARYSEVVPKADRVVQAINYEVNRQRNITLHRVLLDLAAAGAAAGFRLVPLKGAAWLIEDEIGYASWRQMIDLDVLVHPDQFDAVPQWLEAMGYRPDSAAKRFKDHFHHVPYWHPAVPVTLEVHRHLGWRYQLLPPDILWREARPMHRGFWLASPWMRAFHAIIHWQIQDHGSFRRNLPLKELVELDRFLERSDVDWATLAAHAARVDTLERCEQAIASTHVLLSAPIPPQIVPRSAAQRWVSRSIARRDFSLETWIATQKFRAGTLWWCDKVAYRCGLRGMSPSATALRVWIARIARLPLLAVRAAAIAARTFIWAARGARVR